MSAINTLKVFRAGASVEHPVLIEALDSVIEQAERLAKAEALIKDLYNYLGSSPDLDAKLWGKTREYVKAHE